MQATSTTSPSVEVETLANLNETNEEYKDDESDVFDHFDDNDEVAVKPHQQY